MRVVLALVTAALVLVGLPTAQADQPGYLVGRGISDVTGAAAENGMMGYSKFGQNTTGIHQRLRARAFVVVDEAANSRVAYVSADLGMIFQAVHTAVIGKLKARFGTLYTERNVLLSATHTHAGPGGYSHDLAYNLAILGFQQGTFDAVVNGIVESVVEAHGDLKPGTITLGRSELTDASVNRSRVAFEQNPDKGAFPLGIDPAMTVLRFRQGGADVGAISWFATHNTSITNENTLISPDNKGYASYRWEHDDNGVRYLENQPGFVAAFAQTNAGDMSPNLNLRPGSGPTENEFRNTQIIGQRQRDAARVAYEGPQTAISGSVDARMTFVNMGAVAVDGRYTPDGRAATTCSGVVGASTLAGSVEDGPGLPILTEGMVNPIAPLLDALKVDIPPLLAACQSPKLPAVASGLIAATPDVLPLQIVKLGQLHLVSVPAEVTIVSGLRIRQTVAAELGVPVSDVLIQSYANSYSQYVTTPQEYALQQYEGGSTLFGKHTLPAYQQEYAKIARALRAGASVATGTAPVDPAIGFLNLQTGVVFDDKPWFTSFGQVLTEPAASYQRGQTATAVFVTGHPKNNLRRNGTFLEVQRLVGGTWTRVADDGDWSTRYRWAREGIANSRATITWEIPADTPAGSYRIVHHGDWKSGWTGAITGFSGWSRPFTVS